MACGEQLWQIQMQLNAIYLYIHTHTHTHTMLRQVSWRKSYKDSWRDISI